MVLCRQPVLPMGALPGDPRSTSAVLAATAGFLHRPAVAAGAPAADDDDDDAPPRGGGGGRQMIMRLTGG